MTLHDSAIAEHFNAIDDYDGEIPPHIRKYLLERKSKLILDVIRPLGESLHILDVGCGTGWHMAECIAAGHRVTGIDGSERQLKQAAHNAPEAQTVLGDARSLPFPDGMFDAVYAINMLHHVGPPQAQQAALREMARVTGEGGMVIVQEMNMKNPVFRFYMNHVFRHVRSIDCGEEYWLDPQTIAARCGGLLQPFPVRYFTFIPDFTPRALLSPLRWGESRLEHSAIRSFSAHIMLTWKRSAQEIRA